MIYLNLFPDRRGSQGSGALICDELHQPLRIILVIAVLTIVILVWLHWQAEPPEDLVRTKEVRLVPFSGAGTSCRDMPAVLSKIGPTLAGKTVLTEPCRDGDPGERVGNFVAPGEIAIVTDRTSGHPGASMEFDYGKRRVFVIRINPDLQNRWTGLHELLHILRGHTKIPRPQNLVLEMIANTALDLLITPDLVRSASGLAN